jgi:hypothetical protein
MRKTATKCRGSWFFPYRGAARLFPEQGALLGHGGQGLEGARREEMKQEKASLENRKGPGIVAQVLAFLGSGGRI